MQYIRYGPWGQPHPLETGNWLNISKSIEISALKYIYLCNLCYRQCMKHIRYGPLGSTLPPPPRNGKLAEYLEIYWDPHHWTIYIVPCVTGNICNTLDMAPEVNLIPQKWELGWISRKLLRSPPLNHIYSCSMCYRHMQYIRYGPWGQPHPPEMGNWLNISKIIEILTPKPYTFLFLVLQAIYALH
jgi:hypothetical protein